MAYVVLAKMLRAGEQKQVRRLSSIAAHIETLEEDYVDLTDAELRAMTDTFRERFADGETLAAAMRSAGDRVELPAAERRALTDTCPVRLGDG